MVGTGLKQETMTFTYLYRHNYIFFKNVCILMFCIYFFNVITSSVFVNKSIELLFELSLTTFYEHHECKKP